MPGKFDGLVCFAGTDWWYHSQGHNDQQIMKRVVKEMPVLWVNPMGMRFPRPGKTDIVFRRYFRKLFSILRGLRKDSSGLRVFTPLYIPVFSKKFLNINGLLISLQVSLACRILGIKQPVAWITVPTAAPGLFRGKWKKIIFNRCDQFSSNPEVNKELIQGLEQKLLKLSDHVLYSSHLLMLEEETMSRNSIYIGHGVDLNHFSAGKEGKKVPEGLRDLPSPVIGYYGALDTFTIDLELLIRTAKHIYPGTLLLVGLRSMNISPLLRENNVVYHEPVPYEKIPEYARLFDVGIMPWLMNRWIRTANPVKLKEYLSMGFPVVTTSFPELEPYTHLVYTARDHTQFIEQLNHAIKEDDSLLRKKRRKAVSGSSWDQISEKVLTLISIPETHENRNGD